MCAWLKGLILYGSGHVLSLYSVKSALAVAVTGVTVGAVTLVAEPRFLLLAVVAAGVAAAVLDTSVAFALGAAAGMMTIGAKVKTPSAGSMRIAAAAPVPCLSMTRCRQRVSVWERFAVCTPHSCKLAKAIVMCE